ncbi:hypothetical protein D805_0654 [Bifidobacterium thermophilum RBL67]|uniref:Uncharacterized protein n=1 Tax=Bifidobacterium thermophilum RBL67 TaxID=1254439 RepID=M4RBR5_9BIFI|nr:hypothetical protein D805_0654 [Bifidobacterium thermophilum RBL67]
MAQRVSHDASVTRIARRPVMHVARWSSHTCRHAAAQGNFLSSITVTLVIPAYPLAGVGAKAGAERFWRRSGPRRE